MFAAVEPAAGQAPFEKLFSLDPLIIWGNFLLTMTQPKFTH
ncbi:MAG: hypothetical protein AAGI69_25600 [Cyanobacteria bacterium P01_H01_bin.21]